MIEILARSALGGEYVTRDARGVLRHHWMYRAGDPREIGQHELAAALDAGNLFPDGTSVANWAEVGEYVSSRVLKEKARFTDLPPSPALARAALPVLRELSADEQARPRIDASIAHLLRSPGVLADPSLMNELRLLLEPRPVPSVRGAGKNVVAFRARRSHVTRTYFGSQEPTAA